MSDRKIFAYLTIALGVWQLSIILTFSSLFCSTCNPLILSEAISGILLVALGASSAASSFPACAGRLVGVVGFWMQCAPLIFWAYLPMLYLNDTLIGVLAIILSFQIARPKERPSAIQCPKGWSYNPSSWKHRIPVVALAMCCWFFARYMAAYQLGYIPHIWDPFFPDGTLHVITSDVSKAFPVSDAGLGALFYTLEALLGWQGDRVRFATQPWLVFSFAFLVIPVGIVSIVLIILQPVLVGAWCTWCLATALCMLLMIILTAGEFAATLQFLYESVQNGASFWRVFWKGRDVPQGKVRMLAQKDAWGVSVTWNLILSALLGVFLILLPSFMHYRDGLAISDYIVGPICISVSLIAMAEVFRTLRYVLALLGFWCLIAPWVLSHSIGIGLIHGGIGVVLILALILYKNGIKQRYGIWERWMV
jgi:hypothetical protein